MHIGERWFTTSPFRLAASAIHLEITDDGKVSFRVVAGGTDRADFTPHWWHDDEVVYGMEDRNYFVNGLKVLRRVEKMLLDYIRIKKPYAISFSGVTPKKQKVYAQLARKSAEKIPGYMLVEYGDTIMFVKKRCGEGKCRAGAT